MHLRGFDRRGAAGALHTTSTSGFTVSGVFRDAADFCVMMLYEADDFFGHLDLKYLPDFDFTGMVVDFDLSMTNLQNVESLKFPSIDWPFLDYQLNDGTAGTVRLSNYITSRTGRTNPSITYTVNANTSSVIYDRVTLSFENLIWDYIVPGKQSVVFSFFNYHGTGHVHRLIINGTTYSYTQLSGDSSANVASGIAAAAAADPSCSVIAASFNVTLTPISDQGDAINVSAPDDNGPDIIWRTTNAANTIASYMRTAINATSWTTGTPVKLTASGSTNSVVVTTQASNYGAAADANLCAVTEQHKTATTTITPSGRTKFTGGIDSTSVHVSIPFSTVFGSNVTKINKLWFTYAPKLSDGIAYPGQEWSAVYTNWAVTDPSSKRALKIAHPRKSVRVSSSDSWASYTGSSWMVEAGFFFEGFAKRMSWSSGTPLVKDSVTIRYACQHTHDLNIGTSLYSDRGTVEVSLDGDTFTDLDCWLPVEPPAVTRRAVRTSVPAGKHTLTIRHKGTKNASSSNYFFYLDYLEATVRDDVQDPTYTYSDRSAATDYGTDHGYKMSPQRLVWIMDRLGMRGDWNHYVSVFWWNNRRRKGGKFNSATVTFSGWTGIAEGATLRLQFGGATQGDVAGTYLIRQFVATDTDNNLAQYFADYINGNLVGVWASAASNVLTITSRSPIYDFTFWSFATGSPAGTMTSSGSLLAGNEGIWEVDPTPSTVINRGATDWHRDFWVEVKAKSLTAVAAFSLELTSPPDDPSGGQVWAQRYLNGTPVLTATGFGTEGAGFVQSFSSPTVTMTGHGYSTGSSVNIVKADRTAAGSWLITVTGANTFTLDTLIGGTNYGVAAGDIVNRNLQTTHCAFSTVVSDYLKKAHKEMADLMSAATLTPWLQFGEVLHWFFSSIFSKQITGATNASPISITCTGHGISTGESVVISGVQGNTAANGTWTATVVNADTLTLNSSVGNGSYTASTGRLTGGSMALYDDDQTAEATTVLGRSLATFHHQDSDPSINSYADANFLRDRLKAYIDRIRTHVLASHAGAKFELLFPYDVCYKSAYSNNAYPFPQGGRLNRYINVPSAYSTKAGSGLDRLKMEALSWGASYRNIDLAKETVKFPYAVLSWSKADTRYLVPWFNGGCPWKMEHRFTKDEGTPHVNFWAFDQLCLFSWNVNVNRLPTSRRLARAV